MANRNERDLELMAIDGHLFRFSPIELFDLASFGKDVLRVQSSKEYRGEPFLKTGQRVLVQMVVMVVTYEDPVDGWKAIDFAGWSPVPLRPGPLDRGGPV